MTTAEVWGARPRDNVPASFMEFLLLSRNGALPPPIRTPEEQAAFDLQDEFVEWRLDQGLPKCSGDLTDYIGFSPVPSGIDVDFRADAEGFLADREPYPPQCPLSTWEGGH